MTDIVIGMDSTLERLAFTAWRNLEPAWAREHGAEWIEVHRKRMDNIGAVLGLEARMLSDARDEGWDVTPPEQIAEHSLAVRLPDGQIAYHMPDKRYANAPAKVLGDPLRNHLTAFLTGHGAGIRQQGLPELPAICRDVLQADGLDPDAVERLGALTNRIAHTVSGRHHVATFGLQEKFRLEEMARMDAGDYTPPPYSRYAWDGIKMVLSKTPAVYVLEGKVTARVTLPDTIAHSLVGRPASAVFDHPVLQGYTIARATHRPSGFTLKLSKDPS